MADEAINQSLSKELNSLVIDEIIVTAEKRTESLQDVSKAVSVFDADELETKNITDFVGLRAIPPRVTHAKTDEYKTKI
jgi:iron complex outermembrane receptor protein